ncbi:cilia- and flagella-associated protein 206 [Brachyhypopomus gauderio]|uniref:cilia- and flagella-associated protein 206 n=1 Tax=Brachyhypopomus gauderio TaxID=698409 RepID=UPI004041752B
MSRVQAESVIKNIIREIAQQCASKGQAVSETLVAFMVKAVVLDPSNLFNVDRTLTKQDIQKLIELCVDRLLDQKNPALDTIKMQVYFDLNYTSRREFVEEHQRALKVRLLPVCREVTDSRAKTREDLEDLYRKVVSYVLLHSGVGSASDIRNVREATAAVQSVFPQSELATFMSLLKRDKEQQLNELSAIVTGIRLFNKDSSKGGEGIEDLPGALNEALPAVSRDIEVELEGTQQLAWRYTALLEHQTGAQTDWVVRADLLRQALHNVRQHEAFLKLLLADVILCAKQVEILQTELAGTMRMLRATVHSKTAVPTSQVFPHFTALAKLWAGLQDEKLLLSMLSTMVTSLRPFLSAQSQLLGAGELEQLLQGVTVKTDLERMAESAGERVDPDEMKSCEWLLPETTANFDKLPLQYRGVCGYTLIARDSLLLPGNPNIGVLKHREKFYCFSSRQAAYQFASRADECVEAVAERARRSPELIQLLQLHQQFSSVPPYSQMQSGETLLVKPITRSDSCTQTDTHLLESNVVKSYEWNEWELRRQAIKLANLRSKVTRSMQTDLSHMRRHNSTQTYPPKDAAGQTKREGQSNVPRPQIYLAGLRGGETTTTRMTRVNLTRDVDQ